MVNSNENTTSNTQKPRPIDEARSDRFGVRETVDKKETGVPASDNPVHGAFSNEGIGRAAAFRSRSKAKSDQRAVRIQISKRLLGNYKVKMDGTKRNERPEETGRTIEVHSIRRLHLKHDLIFAKWRPPILVSLWLGIVWMVGQMIMN